MQLYTVAGIKLNMWFSLTSTSDIYVSPTLYNWNLFHQTELNILRLYDCKALSNDEYWYWKIKKYKLPSFPPFFFYQSPRLVYSSSSILNGNAQFVSVLRDLRFLYPSWFVRLKNGQVIIFFILFLSLYCVVFPDVKILGHALFIV